jgi:hypothetical protein
MNIETHHCKTTQMTIQAHQTKGKRLECSHQICPPEFWRIQQILFLPIVPFLDLPGFTLIHAPIKLQQLFQTGHIISAQCVSFCFG